MSEQRVVVDRIEGDLAVVEINGMTVDWPVSLLPADTKEGQVFLLRLEPVDTPPSVPEPFTPNLNIKL